MRDFRSFFNKVKTLLQNSYVTDELNISLYAIFLLLLVINIFVFNKLLSIILSLLELGLIIFALYRTFSKDPSRREKENAAFLPIYKAVCAKLEIFNKWIKLNILKFKERKEYKYTKCPVCKAQLRVRRVKGTHTVRCPKCRNEFKKTI